MVLLGAKAIALPLKVGQQLAVHDDIQLHTILWQAFYAGDVWFSCEFNPTDFSVLKTSHPGKSQTLRELFQTIRTLNPAFFPPAGIRIETLLDASPEWGFGSSSTLVSILSQWAGVDPFVLNERIFKGSGFDIACATAKGPVFYLKNEISQPVNLDYPFAEQLFLVYSGQKKGTSGEVNAFLKAKKVSVQLIQEVSSLSDEIALCSEQGEFNRLIRHHEQLIGRAIGKTPVKPEYFNDFAGEIKSLGAWGGDFYLISTALPFSEVRKYFQDKGLTILFRWNDLILKQEQP